MTQSILVPCLKIDQPIGQFYVGVITHADLLAISYVDQRSLRSDMDDFIGIQRKLSPSRVKAIEEYVTNIDATFPTSVIISIHDENCEWSSDARELRIFETTNFPFDEIAKILDGQHRVEGLKSLANADVFELSVTIFVEVDVATQANIFSTVNLAQTKVNRSLVYDLFAYEKVLSPQKSCHEITVALNDNESSPFFKRIKRLGVATPGVEKETLTQAAVVESLLKLISKTPNEDRNTLLRRLRLRSPTIEELHELPFRQLWLNGDENEIAQIVFNYFSAVLGRWPNSWKDVGTKGNVLPKTNGFKALMRFLKPVYRELSENGVSRVPSTKEFAKYFEDVDLEDTDFNIQTFPPGTSGESILYKRLMQACFDVEQA